jgi:hypothetical protein
VVRPWNRRGWNLAAQDCARFVSVACVSLVRALARQAPALPLVLLVALSGCGEEGLLPSTVDPGADFSVADVVFDDSYFYCQVEPVLFASRCGPGDPAQGDGSGGCHYKRHELPFDRLLPARRRYVQRQRAGAR